LNSALYRLRPAFVAAFFWVISLTSDGGSEPLIRVSVKEGQDQRSIM